MDVSIVVPCLNSSLTIQACLESLFSQNFNGVFEVIVVDNGSVDNTQNLVNEFNQENLTLLEELRLGASFARNLGVAHSHSTYIAFVDSDVVVESTWLQELYSYMIKWQLSGVQGQVRPISKADSFLYSIRQVVAKYYTSGKYISLFQQSKSICPFLNTAGVLYKRDAVVRAGKFSHIQFFEDYELSMKIALLGGTLGANSKAMARVHYTGGLFKYAHRAYRASRGWIVFSNKWLGPRLLEFDICENPKTKIIYSYLLCLELIKQIGQRSKLLELKFKKTKSELNQNIILIKLLRNKMRVNSYAVVDGVNIEYSDFFKRLERCFYGK